jgi:CRP-like cAMP-binding protein
MAPTGRSVQRPIFPCGNSLLDALPVEDRADLAAELETVMLSAHDVTNALGAQMEHVDFPIDAMVSVIATLEDGDVVEVGAFGREGFVEVDAVLESYVARRATCCQVAGQVARMPMARFALRMETSPPFALLMRESATAALFRTQQFAACNAQHTVLQRCARWLLMTADRVGREQFAVTHDFLAIMLSVRRAGVSEAANVLQRRGAIEYQRGMVTIVDAARLGAEACECYETCKVASAAPRSSVPS